MDCSPPDSSGQAISQARILEWVVMEWVVMPSSRGSSRPGDQTLVSGGSCIAGGVFATEPPGKPHLFQWLKIMKEILEIIV